MSNAMKSLDTIRKHLNIGWFSIWYQLCLCVMRFTALFIHVTVLVDLETDSEFADQLVHCW